jgi:CheY-like chemotaxis protein
MPLNTIWKLLGRVVKGKDSFFGKAKKILIVDDDPAILETLGAKLAAAGYHVLKAKNGLEAIKLAQADRPNLVIMDLLMPVMGGAGAVIKLKEDPRTKTIPIFFLTAADPDHEDLKQEKTGVDVIFHKPFSFKDLMEKIQEVLGRSA